MKTIDRALIESAKYVGLWTDEMTKDFNSRTTLNIYIPALKQQIKADILEICNIPVYKVTETPSKDYEAGYNDMVTATEILLLEIRSGLEEYFK